jgi:hypothetical protein
MLFVRVPCATIVHPGGRFGSPRHRLPTVGRSDLNWFCDFLDEQFAAAAVPS